MEQVTLSKDDLLASASVKVLRLREIRETLALGDHAAREVKDCLAVAAESIAKLSRPEACFIEVKARQVEGGVVLHHGIEILHEKLSEKMNEHGLIYIYGLSLGYDSGQMMSDLGGDYSLYHFQYYVGRTMLQLMGKDFIRQVRERFPDRQWFRFPVLTQMEGAPRMPAELISKIHYWDPDRLARLLPLLNESKTQFKVTDAGCISPLFSIVGIMLSMPENQSVNT